MLKRFSLSAFVLGAALSISAHGATIQSSMPFYLSGSFTDGATLGGTVDINTIIGSINGEDITVSTLATPFTTAPAQSAGLNNDYQAVFDNGAGATLTLYFDTPSLIGYTGGPLCSEAVACGNDVSGYSILLPDPPLSSGSASSSPAPEPASWMLSLAGFGIAALWRVRRGRA